MLRVQFLQQWFNLSDPAAGEELYGSPVLRQFAVVDLGRAPAPDRERQDCIRSRGSSDPWACAGKLQMRVGFNGFSFTLTFSIFRLAMSPTSQAIDFKLRVEALQRKSAEIGLAGVSADLTEGAVGDLHCANCEMFQEAYFRPAAHDAVCSSRFNTSFEPGL